MRTRTTSMDKGTTQGVNVILLIIFGGIFGGLLWIALVAPPGPWMKWFIVCWAGYSLLSTIFKVTRDMVNGE